MNDREGQNLQANIASQQTSADGLEQTITIQIPTDSSGAAEGDDDGCIRVRDFISFVARNCHVFFRNLVPILLKKKKIMAFFQ